MAQFKFTIYMAGDDPKGRRAAENLRRACSVLSEDLYEIRLVDIRANPEAAEEAGILAVPTTVQECPEPVRRFVGDLGEVVRLRAALDFPEAGV